MLNLDHILFPVDFSEPCLRAAPFVRYFARQTGARVTLLHVIETSPAYYTDWTEYPSPDLRPLMRSESGSSVNSSKASFRTCRRCSEFSGTATRRV